ncbi:MAG TPA: methyltransferase domain-containing protein [Candidatus Sulfotelmatobacter sp.]|jgi:tetratricopeptide (TPR) repeat protein|nr:methyltransferase domain-containing protein [Candidatus Sulfotelmatobacter sp.]
MELAASLQSVATSIQQIDALRQNLGFLLLDAERKCRQALQEQPMLAPAHFLMGMVQIRIGRPSEAVNALRQAVMFGLEQLEFHLEYIRALDSMNRYDEALDAAQTMVLCHPDAARAHQILCDHLLTAGRPQEASAAFRRALELNPELRKVRQAETYKAKARRTRDGFFDAYCQGQGLDIGWGGDLLAANCRGWDIEDGDSETLEGLDDASFDFVYSSHNLEHVNDAEKALKNWWRVIKPGGNLILFLPHRDLYEKKRTLPSRFAEQHKRYFLPESDDPPDTVGVRQLVERLLPGSEIVLLKTCDEGHTITDPEVHSDGEYSIEAVIRKVG